MGKDILSCDAYFDTIQHKKKVPKCLQLSLTAAFRGLEVEQYPGVPGGEVIEIPGDMPIIEAVRILSEKNIMSVPVLNPDRNVKKICWRSRYLGILDYSAIVGWILDNADMAAVELSPDISSEKCISMAIGAVAAAGDDIVVNDVGSIAAGTLDDEFVTGLLDREALKSIMVKSVMRIPRWVPFLPIEPDSSMLTVLLLLSKYRLRNVPVVESNGSHIQNFITQTAIVRGLLDCKGRDWFDYMYNLPLTDFGLPFISCDEVKSINSDDFLLEAFQLMRDNYITGLPVLERPTHKLVGSLSVRAVRFLFLRPDLFSDFRTVRVREFIEAVGTAIPDSGLDAPPLTCEPNDSLGSIIEKIASRYVHRIYVVEGSEPRVIGVITLRDIISCFITEPHDYLDSILRSTVESFYEEMPKEERK
ncbi:SNF1-related protein kinase regulatory subunit gamma-1-like [Rhynchospora pubera]|uniref:SNF1-related protein kinase regulatory subunit gamma-1-like n=1 Tax=Rhynchospora pubera TaxID=906938 RepID=A0AAV8DP38_9POAL|nr:SNF1-related protein kinase regulatory subunit gamma-1-like [Rhynchospora pubera]